MQLELAGRPGPGAGRSHTVPRLHPLGHAGSNIRKVPRPSALALYKARSALRRSSSGPVPPPGVMAMPTLTSDMDKLPVEQKGAIDRLNDARSYFLRALPVRNAVEQDSELVPTEACHHVGLGDGSF